MKFSRRGIMLVIASPSGAGKSSITRRLLKDDGNLTMSVSVTTRKRRDGEIDGTDYHFLDQKSFLAKRESNQLLEWAKVHNNLYGTPAAEVDQLIASGNDVVFDIDYQGTQQLYEKRRADMVTVFLLPPSIPELQKRLRSRAQDSEEVISNRLFNARIEVEHWAEYDYVLVNDELETTCTQVRQILATARLSRTRQTNLSGFIKGLQSQIDSL